jgi:hypothetical protein
MTITFNDSSEIAEAQFEPNPKKKGDILQFDAGDSIKVKYARSGNPGSPKVISSILLAGPMQSELAQSPFDSDSSPIDLVAKPDLTIDSTVGIWGFSVAFTVQNQNSTSFYYLPDPEMEVGST